MSNEHEELDKLQADNERLTIERDGFKTALDTEAELHRVRLDASLSRERKAREALRWLSCLFQRQLPNDYTSTFDGVCPKTVVDAALAPTPEAQPADPIPYWINQMQREIDDRMEQINRDHPDPTNDNVRAREIGNVVLRCEEILAEMRAKSKPYTPEEQGCAPSLAAEALEHIIKLCEKNDTAQVGRDAALTLQRVENIARVAMLAAPPAPPPTSGEKGDDALLNECAKRIVSESRKHTHDLGYLPQIVHLTPTQIAETIRPLIHNDALDAAVKALYASGLNIAERETAIAAIRALVKP